MSQSIIKALQPQYESRTHVQTSIEEETTADENKFLNLSENQLLILNEPSNDLSPGEAVRNNPT